MMRSPLLLLHSNDIVLYAPIVLMLVAIIYWLCRVLVMSTEKRNALGAKILAGEISRPLHEQAK